MNRGKSVAYISFVCCALVVIAVGANYLLRKLGTFRNDRKGMAAYRATEEQILRRIDQMDIAQEMYRLGYILFAKALYNEADQIFRYVLRNHSGSEWANRAEAVLLSKKFYEFYSQGQVISNVFWQIDDSDEVLFDTESVRRKYGWPETIKKQDKFCDEKWIYIKQREGEVVTGEFNFSRGYLHGSQWTTSEGRLLRVMPFRSRLWVHPRERGSDGLWGGASRH